MGYHFSLGTDSLHIYASTSVSVNTSLIMAMMTLWHHHPYVCIAMFAGIIHTVVIILFAGCMAACRAWHRAGRNIYGILHPFLRYIVSTFI